MQRQVQSNADKASWSLWLNVISLRYYKTASAYFQAREKEALSSLSISTLGSERGRVSHSVMLEESVVLVKYC
jgi:hypothetical protein